MYFADKRSIHFEQASYYSKSRFSKEKQLVNPCYTMARNTFAGLIYLKECQLT